MVRDSQTIIRVMLDIDPEDVRSLCIYRTILVYLDLCLAATISTLHVVLVHQEPINRTVRILQAWTFSEDTLCSLMSPHDSFGGDREVTLLIAYQLFSKSIFTRIC